MLISFIGGGGTYLEISRVLPDIRPFLICSIRYNPSDNLDILTQGRIQREGAEFLEYPPSSDFNGKI